MEADEIEHKRIIKGLRLGKPKSFSKNIHIILSFYLPFLISLVIGLGTGIILMAKLLEKSLT